MNQGEHGGSYRASLARSVVVAPEVVRFLPFVAGALVGVSAAVAATLSSAFAVLTLLVGAAMVYAAYRLAKRVRAVSPPENDGFAARLAVRAGALDVSAPGTSREIPLKRLRSGCVVPSRRTGRARLDLTVGGLETFQAWLPDAASARALLDELGLSARHRPRTFHFFFNLRVTVGLDGVLVALPLIGRTRFVPFARIRDVTSEGARVRLTLVNGVVFEIETGAGRDGEPTDNHLALVERLDDARAAYAASASGQSLAALARAGRSTQAWVRELRALSEMSGSQYRSASLPVEALWRVALDAAEREELRTGAALALRANLDDEGRARLRVAAEASVSPRVRVALDAITADLDDERLAERLDEDVVGGAARRARGPG